LYICLDFGVSLEYGNQLDGKMVEFISFTERRIEKIKVNERLRDTVPSLSVTKLKKGNKIVFRWKKRIRKSTEYPELTLGSYPSMSINGARRQALEYDALAEQGIHPRQKEEQELLDKQRSSITLKQILEDYNNFRLEFNAPSTIKQRTDLINLVFDDYMDKPIHILNAQNMNQRYQEWRTQRIAPNRNNKNGSPYSARLALRYLNSLLNYAVDFEFIEKNPLKKIHKQLQIFQKAKSKGLYLQPDECQKLVQGIYDLTTLEYEGRVGISTRELSKVKGYKESWRSWHSLVGYRLMSLLMFTGLRVGDVARLKWETVFLKGNDMEKTPHFTLNIQKNKDKLFAIPITTTMAIIFREMKAYKFDSPYVFPNIVDTKAIPILKRFKKNDKGGYDAPAYMINSKKQMKKRYKLKSQLRIDKTKGYGSLGRVCENIETFVFPDGYRWEATTKMMPQLLRHNFASHGRECGLSDEQIEMVTGHSNSFDDRKLGNSTLNYVRNLISVNKPLFEIIESGLMGELYADIVL
jgi:integrase